MLVEISIFGIILLSGTIYVLGKTSEKKISDLEKKIIKKEEKENYYKSIENIVEEEKKYTKPKMSYAEKIKKGKEYEAYIANYFRENGWTVWEHGKEKGRKDKSIDLIIKKDRKIYFVQCKNWESWKITHKEVKATRQDIREYIKTNKDFWQTIKDYENKILYVTSKECLTKGAYRYIQENKDILEYQVIPMKDDFEDF